MKTTLVVTAVALVAMSILALPSMVLADNGKGTSKSNQKVVVEPPSGVTNYTKSSASITAASQPITSKLPSIGQVPKAPILTMNDISVQGPQNGSSNNKWYDNPNLISSAKAAKAIGSTGLDLYGSTISLPGLGRAVSGAGSMTVGCVGWEIGRATAIKDFGVDPGHCWQGNNYMSWER